jgi:hypothetical protein
MLGNIGQWIVTVPLDNPWRAIVLVLMVLVFAFILHMLWDLGFMLAGALSRMPANYKSGGSVSTNRPYIAMSAARAPEISSLKSDK